MPLRPGESFLQGSARVGRQRASAAAVAPFVPQLTVPKKQPRIPPIPKAVKEWEKKKPLQKVKEAGFLGAVANDQAVARFRYARMAPTLARAGRLEAPDPTFVQQDRARAELARLEKVPQKERRSDYWAKVAKARSGSGRKHALSYDIQRGLWAGAEPIREYLSGRAWESEGPSAAGLALPTPRIVSDALEVGAKMAVGLPVGVAGAVRHPLRVPGQVKDIVSDVVQPVGLAMASTSSSKARQKLWEDFLRESLTAMEQQYGPETSWSESVRQSYDQGIIAALQGLAVVAPAFKLGALAKGVSPKLALTETGLKFQTGKGLRQALKETSTPAEPRIVRLRGGKEALGRDVEIRWARSPMTRALVQRPYDVFSRRISEEAPIVGKLSEAQRAARVTRRQIKRDVRRAQADAANVLSQIGDQRAAENLRAVYTRGKPEGVDEDTWLRAQLDDVEEMLAGREMIRRGRPSPKLAQLRRRVATLQKKYDRTLADVEASTVERKLEGLSGEQLAVARGEPVGPVPDSPARSQMSAVFTEALGDEQGGVAMQVADQLARGAEPDNPSAWYERILTQFAEDPEASGIDLANALLQEAGPRRSLSGQALRYGPEDVGRAFSENWTIALPDGREGRITHFDHDTKQAEVDIYDDDRYETGETITVPYSDLRSPYWSEEPEPVFYSAAQKMVAEKLPPKVSPEQLGALLEKGGIKKAELEWTGLDSWIQVLKESGVRSVSKEEVIDYLANPLNAFDLSETLWVESDYSHRTKWGPEDYTGVTLSDVPGDYKELMMQLPGEEVYRSSGHMPGISNPIVQLRFHEVNRQGYNEILIDEMQSDWAAAIRDVDYETKGPDSEARLEAIRAERGKLMLGAIERTIDALQIPYDAIPGGTSDISGTRMYVNELRQKLDADFREQSGIGRGVIQGDENAALWNAWMATPERKLITRIERHLEAVTRRMQNLSAQERKIVNAPADMPYKKTWELLGLKRMVAYAVQHGFDAISWPQGIVPAVRYQKVEVEDYLEPRYTEPSEHPEYPDAEDYSRSHTYAEHEFASFLGDVDEFQQERLFGLSAEGGPIEQYRWNAPDEWNIPGPVPMSETTPLTMTAEELGIQEIDQRSPYGPTTPTLSPDDLIYMEEGPYANQFIRVARVNEDGTYDVLPSLIESVEFRGDGSDSGGGWSEYEVTVTENGRQSYGSGSTAGDALRSANFDDLADSEWFDDVEAKLDRGWQSELDDDLYREAVEEFMDRWNNGEIEDSAEYAGLAEAEDVAAIDYSHYKGNAYRYDTIFTSAAKKEWKKYGVNVEKASVEGAFTVEGTGKVSTTGQIPTWRMEIPEALANDVRQGQSFFQAVYPVSGSTTPIVKGAVELMGNRRFRMTLFGQADISTALHELGHIALYDLDPGDLSVIERELGGGRALADWTRNDHERFARAWERFFQEGHASTTSLRGVFMRLMGWMRQVYNGVKASGDPISPEVQRVFEKRLGKVGIDEADRLPPDPALARWGTLLSQAKSELEAYEQRAEIARQKGTDEALRAELEAKLGQRDEAQQVNDRERFDNLTQEIRAIEKELRDRDALNAMRVERRRKLLFSRADELRKALQKPDSRRYEGAQAAADFFQDERETILRDVFGEQYDDIFAGRRQQMSAWLAERGHLPESAVGEGRGFLPFRRRGGPAATIKQAASPVTRRFGRGRTNDLNLNSRNEMVLWQQGDYQASIEVLHDAYMRALSFKYQHDLRRLLHQIGEPVDVTGPKEGWYLVDPDASPLPREWKSARTEEIDADVQAVLDGLAADDAQLALQLQHFAENWLHTDPAKARQPDGGYGNVRQVHPKIVHQLMLPYTGNQLWNPAVRGLAIANTLARTSLIYTAPGYIPSNILANVTLLLGERGLMSVWDLFDGARLVMKDRTLGRRVRAEMGETFTTSKLRADTGEVLAMPRRVEGALARGLSFVADDWVRAAAWSGVARRNGYRGREAQMRLLDAKTEKTRRDRDRIADQATRAMIDFDRLSPWEQRYLRPLVFVWPFIRGATAWPIDYVKEHPFRAGAIVSLTHGFGEAQREELGPTPDYYTQLVPIDIEQGQVANLGSVGPLGPFGDTSSILTENVGSLITGEKVGAFRNLAGFLAPQNDLLLQIIRGQGEFGEAASLREIVTKAGPEFVPFLSLYLDTLDETKPATQLDQGVVATLSRRTFRFTPQRMNLALLNQQAKERGEAKTTTQKMVEARTTARSAWNQLMPGDHMPRAIEDSIKAYYIVQANRALLKDEIKKHQRESWQPTRRDPKLTPLQEAAIVFDVLAAQHPDMVEGAPDPREVFDEYGEQGVDRYRRNIEGVLFMGKRRADEARRKAKQMQKAGIG